MKNHWVKRPLRIGGLTLLLLLAIGIGIGLQGRGVVQAEEETTIKPTMVRVQGYAEQTTAPTIAYLTLGAQSQADDVKTAQAQNTKDMDAVLGAIKEKGIPDNHIQTVNYYVNPRYDNYGASITGYEVIHAVRVKVEDIDKAGEIIDAAIEAGANHSNQISFDITDAQRDALYKEAMKEAVKQAEGNAKILAESIGKELGTVAEVIEGGAAQPTPRYDGIDYAMAGEGAGIHPGETRVGATVTLIYNTK